METEHSVRRGHLSHRLAGSGGQEPGVRWGHCQQRRLGSSEESPVQAGNALTHVLELQSGGHSVPAGPQRAELAPNEPEDGAMEGPGRTVRC